MFLSGLKSRQVDSVKLPPIRCDPLNMRHQDFSRNNVNDFIWWYMGVIKEGVLTDVGSII